MLPGGKSTFQSYSAGRRLLGLQSVRWHVRAPAVPILVLLARWDDVQTPLGKLCSPDSANPALTSEREGRGGPLGMIRAVYPPNRKCCMQRVSYRPSVQPVFLLRLPSNLAACDMTQLRSVSLPGTYCLTEPGTLRNPGGKGCGGAIPKLADSE